MVPPRRKTCLYDFLQDRCQYTLQLQSDASRTVHILLKHVALRSCLSNTGPFCVDRNTARDHVALTTVNFACHSDPTLESSMQLYNSSKTSHLLEKLIEILLFANF